MATSGSVISNTTYESYFWVRWSYQSQSITDNKTTISWSCGFVPGHKFYTNAVKMSAVTIAGTQVYSGGTYSNITDYKERTFASGTLDISHNSDGTKSFSIGAFSGQVYKGSGYLTSSASAQSFDLPTIPRATTPSIGNVTIGSRATISLPRASSSFTHTLTYQFGTASGTIAQNAGDTAYWDVPMSLASQVPNAASGVGTLTCKTYNGETLIGSKDVTFTAAVPASVVPTLSIALSDPTGNKTKYGGYVRTRSKVKVDISASGAYGSTIKAYAIKVGDILSVAAYSGTTDYLPTDGTVNIACSVTDSRGRTSSATASITVLPYTKPTVTSIDAARCNADGTPNKSGTYGKVTFTASVASLTSKNTATYAVQYREYGTESWSNAGNTAGGNYAPQNVSVVFAASKDVRYEVRVVATDAFEAVGSSIRDIPAAFFILHHAKHLLSVGIGRLCNKQNKLQVALSTDFDGDVDVGGTLKIGGKSLFDLIYPVGSVYIAFNDTNPGALFGGKWERIQEAFLWAVGSDGGNLGGRGGEMTHTLTVGEMPSHGHKARYTKSGGTLPWGIDWSSTDQGTITGPAEPYSGISYTGGGQAHNNMPPYIQVSMWRRTA